MPNPTAKLPPALPLKPTRFHFCDLNPRIMNSHLSTVGNIFRLRFELQQSLFTQKDTIERPDQMFTVIWPVKASPTIKFCLDRQQNLQNYQYSAVFVRFGDRSSTAVPPQLRSGPSTSRAYWDFGAEGMRWVDDGQNTALVDMAIWISKWLINTLMYISRVAD